MSKSQTHPLLGIITLVVFLVIFAIAGIVLFLVSDSINTGLQADDSLTQESKDSYGAFNAKYPSMIDGGFLFLFIGIWLALLIGAFFVRDHPLVFLILFILMGILLYAGAMMSNFYQELASDADLITYSAQLPNITFIMEHLVEFIIGLFATIGLVMMFKPQQTI
jgi:ammonia channel protein AmtB